MAHIPEKPTNQFSKEQWQDIVNGLESGRISPKEALEKLQIDEKEVAFSEGFIYDLTFYVVINHFIEGSEAEDVRSDSGDPKKFFVAY